MSQDRKTGFNSANQAYKNFLEESGQSTLPKPEQTPFKVWLEQAKATGSLSGLVNAVKDTVNKAGADKFGDASAAASVGTTAKPFRPLGLHPLVAIGIVILVAGSIYGIYHVSKGKK